MVATWPLALPRFKTGRAAKEWELADALEDLCLELETYGLSLEWNVPTARYTNDPTIGRHKGNWIERHAVTVCGELLSEYEEELVSVLQTELLRAWRQRDAATANGAAARRRE